MNNDKKFKWLLIVASLTCIIIAVVWRYPDAVKANATKDIKLGECIYIDRLSKVHVSRKCPKLNYKGLRSKRIKVDDMYFYYKDTPIKDISFCPQCVDDKDYEKIVNKFSEQLEKRVNEIIENKSQDQYDSPR